MVVFAVQSNVYLQIGDRVSAAVKNTLETITAADGCPVVTLQTDVVPQRQGPTLECLILADLAVDQQGKAVQLRRRLMVYAFFAIVSSLYQLISAPMK